MHAAGNVPELQYFSEMATLADELLNDFEESGSDDDHQDQSSSYNDADGLTSQGVGVHYEGIDMDVDAEDQDEDEAMTNEKLLNELQTADDAEEAKSRVEKMQLAGVNDVRSVATLKRSLEPILKVSWLSSPFLSVIKIRVYIRILNIA